MHSQVWSVTRDDRVLTVVDAARCYSLSQFSDDDNDQQIPAALWGDCVARPMSQDIPDRPLTDDWCRSRLGWGCAAGGTRIRPADFWHVYWVPKTRTHRQLDELSNLSQTDGCVLSICFITSTLSQHYLEKMECSTAQLVYSFILATCPLYGRDPGLLLQWGCVWGWVAGRPSLSVMLSCLNRR